MAAAAAPGLRLLVLNPNSSKEMTEGMRKAVRATQPPADRSFEYYTAPKPSPASINDGDGLARSTDVVLADLDSDDNDADDKLEGYDAVLVACYSVHPLVSTLARRHRGRKVVLGIFEASVLSALALTAPYPRDDGGGDLPGRAWGIVTTGKFWEKHLEDGVMRFLGSRGPSNAKFAGVYSTGLDGSDFHGGVDPDVVSAKVKDATRKLLAFGRIGCVVMGCASMAGLDDIIRSAIIEQYGEPKGPEDKVYIIDGVKAGAGLLAEAVRNERMFSQ